MTTANEELNQPPAPPEAPEASAQAPAAPVAPQLTAPDQAPAATEPSAQPAPAKFEPTGDPLLDTALEWAANLGIGSDDEAIEAAKDGDFTLIEQKLTALGDKAKDKDRYLALAKKAYEQHAEEAKARVAEIAKVVHREVGGEAQWKAIQVWASAKASDAEREQINAALAAGGLQAAAAARYLRDAFVKAGRPGVPKAAATAPDSGAPAAGPEPLGSREYGRLVDQLAAANRGKDLSNLPEYQALRARRLAGRAAGLK